MNPPYTHLSLDERRELFRLHSAKIPMRVIAQRLNRHPSTLYREIKRNWFHDEEPLYRGYFHVAAHAMAHGRRARLSKLSRKPALAAYVVERLQAAWSPEQIAGRLRASGAPGRRRMRRSTVRLQLSRARPRAVPGSANGPAPAAGPCTSVSRAASSFRLRIPSSSVRRADCRPHELWSLGRRSDDVPKDWEGTTSPHSLSAKAVTRS